MRALTAFTWPTDPYGRKRTLTHLQAEGMPTTLCGHTPYRETTPATTVVRATTCENCLKVAHKTYPEALATLKAALYEQEQTRGG